MIHKGTDVLPIYDTGHLDRGKIYRRDIKKLLPHPDGYGFSIEVIRELKKLQGQGKVIRYQDLTFPKAKLGYAWRDPKYSLAKQIERETLRSMRKGVWKSYPEKMRVESQRIRGKIKFIEDTKRATSIAERLQSFRKSKARAADGARQAKIVVPVGYVDYWRRNPGRVDIKGIDTPSKRKKR